MRRLVFSSTAAVYGAPTRSPSPRTPRSRRSTRTARRSAASRAPCAGTPAPTGCAASACATSTWPAPPRANGEVHEPETHLIPNVLRRLEGARRADGLRDRLPDAGRHLHPRLHPRRGPGAGAPRSRSRRRRPDDARTAGPDGGAAALALNLGNGGGFSVREVLAAAETATGRPGPARASARGAPATRRCSWRTRAAPGRSSAGRRRTPTSARSWRRPGPGAARTRPGTGPERSACSASAAASLRGQGPGAEPPGTLHRPGRRTAGADPPGADPPAGPGPGNRIETRAAPRRY